MYLGTMFVKLLSRSTELHKGYYSRCQSRERSGTLFPWITSPAYLHLMEEQFWWLSVGFPNMPISEQWGL